MARAMLVYARMTRVCLLATVIVAALAATSSKKAEAGGYLGFGVGTAPSLSDDRLEADGRSVKALIGQRWGQFSLEGAVNGFDLVNSSTVIQASAAGKLSLPLGDGFEVFGRGGLGHNWFRAAKDVNNMEGNGFLLGVGVEYRLDLTVASGSIFIDYTYNKVTFEDDRSNQLELNNRMWTLGLTVGI